MIIEWLQPLFMLVGMNKAWAFIASYGVLIFGILLVSLIANYLTKRYIHFISRRILSKAPSRWVRAAIQRKLFYRLSHIAPALVIYASIPLIQLSDIVFTASVVKVIMKLTLIYMIGVVVFVITSLLNVIDDLYQGLEKARRRPIKSYLQLVLLFVYIIAGVLIVSAILERSPLVFFTGLGAMMAILMLVFKDTILGLVASVQNAQADIMHIGDWVEIPQYGIDGEVVDVALNTIKFQNFDKTIVTLPAQTILAGGIKNWRGMEESGGRRIKRPVYIDIQTIKFCTPKMLEDFQKITYLKEYIQRHANEQLTNVGLFREYIKQYLKNHKDLRTDFTFFVRHLDPTDRGLPIEIYVFTTKIEWAAYEDTQAQIFDHILAMIPAFELKVFQSSSAK